MLTAEIALTELLVFQMNPLEKLEDVLRSCDRVFVASICLLVPSVFYWTGLLQIFTAALPSIFYLPIIAAISGILRWVVEARLGKKRLPSAGKAVFITGCDSGFGNSLSRRLANKGSVEIPSHEIAHDDLSHGCRLREIDDQNIEAPHFRALLPRRANIVSAEAVSIAE